MHGQSAMYVNDPASSVDAVMAIQAWSNVQTMPGTRT
jgi:hypothetical protein